MTLLYECGWITDYDDLSEQLLRTSPTSRSGLGALQILASDDFWAEGDIVCDVRTFRRPPSCGRGSSLS